MQNQKKYTSISVIIPWGKKAGSISKCVQNALAQTYPANEIIIIANGQVTNNDADSLKCKFKDASIKIHHLPGCKNANIARNFGTALAKSDLIAFLDSDDYWDESHLKESIEQLHHSNAHFIYSGMRILYENSEPSNLAAENYKMYGSMENYLLSYRPAQTSSYLIKRECVLEILWDNNLRRHQDYDFIARLSHRFDGCIKNNITVNIDWTTPTKHKAHKDCFYVTDSFKKNARKDLYSRHLTNLTISSIKSNDFAWVKYIKHTAISLLMRSLNKIIKL